MSRQKTICRTNYPKVLVRAFRGEPAEMVAVSANGDRVSVARAAGGPAISLPAKIVRRFDEALYSRLCAAFKATDERLLSALWDQAKGIGAGVDLFA